MSLDPLEQQLLQNIHKSVEKLTEDHTDFVQRLTRIETNQDDILGNGQPGRLARVENGLANLRAFNNKTKGAFAVIGVLSGGSLIGILKLWALIAPNLPR